MNERNTFFEMLKNNKTVIRYKKLEEVINNDKNLKQQIVELKQIQKQLINAKEYNKPEMVKQYQIKYDIMYNEISEIPLISEYLALQSDINYFVQEVQNIIEEGIENKFSE